MGIAGILFSLLLLMLLASAGVSLVVLAPLLGLIGGGVILGLGIAWLTRRTVAAKRAGEGYGETPSAVASSPRGNAGAPPFSVAILPIVAVVSLNFFLTEFVIRHWDTAYLAEPRYVATTVVVVLGSFFPGLVLAA